MSKQYATIPWRNHLDEKRELYRKCFGSQRTTSEELRNLGSFLNTKMGRELSTQKLENETIKQKAAAWMQRAVWTRGRSTNLGADPMPPPDRWSFEQVKLLFCLSFLICKRVHLLIIYPAPRTKFCVGWQQRFCKMYMKAIRKVDEGTVSIIVNYFDSKRSQNGL